jgi:hypothetical protein
MVKDRSRSREHDVNLDNRSRKYEGNDKMRVSQCRLLASGENQNVLTNGEKQKLLTNGETQSFLINDENQNVLTNGNIQSPLEQPLNDKLSKEERRQKRRSSRSRERLRADQQARPIPASQVVSSDSGPSPRVVSSDSGPVPATRVVRSVSEPGIGSDTCEGVVRSLSQGSEGHEEIEWKMELRNLQEEV